MNWNVQIRTLMAVYVSHFPVFSVFMLSYQSDRSFKCRKFEVESFHFLFQVYFPQILNYSFKALLDPREAKVASTLRLMIHLHPTGNFEKSLFHFDNFRKSL